MDSNFTNSYLRTVQRFLVLAQPSFSEPTDRNQIQGLINCLAKDDWLPVKGSLTSLRFLLNYRSEDQTSYLQKVFLSNLITAQNLFQGLSYTDRTNQDLILFQFKNAAYILATLLPQHQPFVQLYQQNNLTLDEIDLLLEQIR